MAVVVVGSMFKVVYFNFSRGVMVDNMDKRHLQATEHLGKRREFGSQMAQERKDKAPQLTTEQEEQLQEYLRLMKETQPIIFPKDSGRRE